MKARTKSAFILLATLVVGGVVGALATGAAFNNRVKEIESLRNRGGFAERMEAVIEPHDEAQRAQIRAVLERAHARYIEDRRSCGAAFAASTDSMRADLAPLLTPEQAERLEAWLSRDRDRDRRERERRPDEKTDRRPPNP